MTVFTYLTGIGWILITCASTLPVYFYFVARQQCDAINSLEDDSTADNYCIYLDQTGEYLCYVFFLTVTNQTSN